MKDSVKLLEVRELKKHFSSKGGLFSRRQIEPVKAVDGVNLVIHQGEVLGLIGESGCGKSTLARLVMGLIDLTEGEVYFKDQLVTKQNRSLFRKKVQMIFQDPYSSLDPRMRVGRIIEEPLRVHSNMSREERHAAVLPLLDHIGFTKEDLRKYPHEFSGGERQRIGIARALILYPELLICDEPVSSLDVSIQASILNLFKSIKKEMDLSYLFISHDMSVVKHVSDRIAVMYLGKIVELADKKALFERGMHPYSLALMDSIPVPDPLVKRKPPALSDDAETVGHSFIGCSFANRCPKTMPICQAEAPVLQEVECNHFVSCHLYSRGGQE